MPAISAVFTIRRVARMLGEDEDWLHEISTVMMPEDGACWIYDLDKRHARLRPAPQPPGALIGR